MTEWHADEYVQHSGLQQAAAAAALRSLTLAGDERVLDVGCGDGRITAEIAGRLPRGSAVGVDPSRQMIEFATRSFGPPVHGNLRFEVGDAQRLRFRDEFDLVTSFNALHWAADQAAALRSIRAALKPGGRASMRLVSLGPRKSLEAVIEDVRRRPRWAGAFQDFAQPFVHSWPEDYRRLAEDAGLRVVGLRVEDDPWDFKTREGFAGFARATFVEWTRRLPQDQWDEFIGESIDAYRAEVDEVSKDEYIFKFYQMQVELERGG